MGPLISSNQERVVQDYIKFGLDAGFDLVTGGHKLSGDGYDHGYYVEPTIFEGRRNASRLGQEEIFGPVVAVTTFSDERGSGGPGERGGFRTGGRGMERRLPTRHAGGPSDSRRDGSAGSGTITPNPWRASGVGTSRVAWGGSWATTG